MMERRVTRAMAKAKGTPFTESVVNKKSRPNFGSQNDISVSKAKLLNGPDSFRSKHLSVKAKMVGMNGSTGQINRVAVNFASSAPLSLIPNSEQIPQSSQVPNIDKVTPAAPPVVKRKPKGMQFDSIYVEYNDAFIKACNSLINYSRKWSDLLTISRDVIPEEICGDIESSVGQAKLLLESKLPQFAELLYHYLSKHEGPQPVMPEDLQGWWAVAIISIDNVKNRFEKLAVLEKNQWVEEQQFLENNRIVKLQSSGVRRRSSIHKNTKPSSGLLAFLAEKRRKALEDVYCNSILSATAAARPKSPKRFTLAPALSYGTSSLPAVVRNGDKIATQSRSREKNVLSRRSVDDDFLVLMRRYTISSGYRPGVILGIETSCDDTGVAVVNHEKKILGESLNAQLQIHLNHGGVIPPIAKHLHEQHIERVLDEAISAANITLDEVDAIATTVKPGLALSLSVGVKHGKELCLKAKKPFIPIHHMEAHALTPRMLEEIEFPYMVLLISGGHCLLAIAKSINEFLLLGKTIDDAPGEAFDKTARRLKLHNNADASSISGGQAIEQYAKKGNPEAFRFPTPMHRYRDCNWSFSGLKFIAQRQILWEERKYEIDGSDIIPSIHDLCASFQHAVVTHLCKKIHRGMIYADMRKLIGQTDRKLVVSGGVACNNYIRRGIELVCKEMGYEMIAPPNNLCTDNGVMIAWNGIEKWNAGIDIIPVEDLESIEIESKAPFGKDLYEDIRNLDIKCKRIPMADLFKEASIHRGRDERGDMPERETVREK